MKATNIKWDTDGNMEVLKELPTEMEIPEGITRKNREKDKMNKTLSLMNLVNRIKFDQKQIKIHPERVDILNRHMDKQKEYLVELCLENADNPLLEQIIL